MSAQGSKGFTVLAHDFDVPSRALPSFDDVGEQLSVPTMGWRRPHSHALAAATLSTAILTGFGAPHSWQAWVGAGSFAPSNDWMLYADPTTWGNAAGLSARAAAIGDLIRYIGDFQSRMPNWDGDDGIAPRPAAIHDALAFLRGLRSGAPVPGAVFAPGDGEIMFQWRTPTAFVEVGFHGDGLLSWGAEIDGICRYGDEVFNLAAPNAHAELMSVLTTL